jgi:hypothetical protein
LNLSKGCYKKYETTKRVKKDIQKGAEEDDIEEKDFKNTKKGGTDRERERKRMKIQIKGEKGPDTISQLITCYLEYISVWNLQVVKKNWFQIKIRRVN